MRHGLEWVTFVEESGKFQAQRTLFQGLKWVLEWPWSLASTPLVTCMSHWRRQTQTLKWWSFSSDLWLIGLIGNGSIGGRTLWSLLMELSITSQRNSFWSQQTFSSLTCCLALIATMLLHASSSLPILRRLTLIPGMCQWVRGKFQSFT